MGNSLVWQYTKEPYVYELPYTEARTIFLNAIRREDGFTVIKLLSHDDDRFLCRGEFGEFRFIASRKETFKSEPTDKYIVYPDKFDPKWPGDEKENRELCLAHLKDIEDALLHFPTVFYFDYMPQK